MWVSGATAALVDHILFRSVFENMASAVGVGLGGGKEAWRAFLALPAVMEQGRRSWAHEAVLERRIPA